MNKNKKVDIYFTLRRRVCPVCGSKDSDQLYSNPDYKYIDARNIFYHSPIYYVMCNYCVHIYKSPAPDEVEFKELYTNAIIEPPTSLDEESARQKSHMSFFVEMMDKYFSKLKSKISVFEIGCGNGNLLYKINMKYGKKIYSLKGIEPSVHLSRTADTLPFLKVENRFFDEIELDEKYDLIIMDNVFEHFDYPSMELKRLKKILRRDGKIYMSIPNIFIPNYGFGDIFSGHPCNYIIENLMLLLDNASFYIEDYKYRSKWLNLIIRLKGKFDKLLDFNFKEIKYKVLTKLQENFSKKDLKEKKIRTRLVSEIKNMDVNNQKLLIFGAGCHTLELLSNLDFNDIIMGILDSNNLYRGKIRMGYPVYSPEELGKLSFDKILLSSKAFEQDMKNMLLDRGVGKNQIIALYSEN